MRIREHQRQVRKLNDHIRGEASAPPDLERLRAIVRHLARETIELRDIVDRWDELGEVARLRFQEEAADVFILTAQACNDAGADLEEGARVKMEINWKRNWPKVPDREGVYEHEKEGD